LSYIPGFCVPLPRAVKSFLKVAKHI